MLPNMSRSKDNKRIKLGQLIEYIKFFFKNYAENKVERLVPELFLFFLKSLIWSKGKWSAA